MKLPGRPGPAAFVLVALTWTGAALLHRHEFGRTVTQYDTSSGLFRSYLIPSLPIWKDPAAVALAFGGPAVALGMLSYAARRLALAVGVVGFALVLSVYVYQRQYHPVFCPPGVLCTFMPALPGWRSDPVAVEIAVWGILAAAGVLVWRLPLPGAFGSRWRPNSLVRTAFALAACIAGLYLMALGNRDGWIVAVAALAVVLRGARFRLRREATSGEELA